MGHNMMLEPGWVVVAEGIHTWLHTCDLASRSERGRECR